jgi:hypothetical protein
MLCSVSSSNLTGSTAHLTTMSSSQILDLGDEMAEWLQSAEQVLEITTSRDPCLPYLPPNLEIANFDSTKVTPSGMERLASLKNLKVKAEGPN